MILKNHSETILLRHATSPDIRILYPQGMPYTIKAMVLEKDGTPIGIGGIAYRPEGNMVFLNEGDYAAHGVSQLRAARAILTGFRKLILPELRNVFVSRDICKPSSERLLQKLGFVCIFKENDEEIWRCPA